MTLHPDERARIGLEELYVQLDKAIDAAAELTATAQAVLPDDVSIEAFRALQSLAMLKQRVNPGPTEEDPF